VLTIVLEEAQVQALGKLVSQPETAQIEVDLPAQEIRLKDGQVMPFKIDELRKNALLLGLDAIGSTLQKREQILAFQQRHLAENPWLS
jgi:3-isopropylmalate/(R)-2-methylmalate dehydratase small subunit